MHSGSVTIGDGATMYVGGFLTADQYQGAAAIPGVTWHPAADPLFLDGTLDNSPADNPATRGVLSASTNPLVLAGGTIAQGSLTIGSKVQVIIATPIPTNIGPLQFPPSFVAAGGSLDNVTNGSTLTDTGTFVILSNVTNNGTVSGNIGAVVEFQNTWANPGTIRIDGTSSLYLGSPAFIADPHFPPTLADGSAFALNQGTIGSIAIADGATWRTDGADITTNAANLSISGAGTQVLDAIFTQGNNPLADLTTNAATGHFTVDAGYTFTVQGSFLNAGILEIGGTVSIQGNYTQTAGAALDIDIAGPSTYGTLAVGGTAALAGTLNVALVNGFTPAAGSAFTILSFGARSGDFSTENGLMFSPGEFFVPEYLGNTLTLVVVP
jgi:hypothetical protein